MKIDKEQEGDRKRAKSEIRLKGNVSILVSARNLKGIYTTC